LHRSFGLGARTLICMASSGVRGDERSSRGSLPLKMESPARPARTPLGVSDKTLPPAPPPTRALTRRETGSGESSARPLALRRVQGVEDGGCVGLRGVSGVSGSPDSSCTPASEPEMKRRRLPRVQTKEEVAEFAQALTDRLEYLKEVQFAGLTDDEDTYDIAEDVLEPEPEGGQGVEDEKHLGYEPITEDVFAGPHFPA
jgi:hypothetical protein